jgi:hypothetical protein
MSLQQEPEVATGTEGRNEFPEKMEYTISPLPLRARLLNEDTKELDVYETEFA